MFVDPSDHPPPHSLGRPREAGPARRWNREPLALLAERTRPISSSQTRLLPVLSPLIDLFPDGGLRRGSTVVITGLDGTAGGGLSLALALVAAASKAGSWCSLVGVTGLGAVAAHDFGVDLARLAVVPRPGAAWPDVVGTLVDGVDLVVLRPPFAPRPTMAARVAARVRERRSVLVVLAGQAGWPEPPDIHLRIDGMQWDGAGAGEGFLQRRRVSVSSTGRRAAARPRHRWLWMPSPRGAVLGMAAEASPTVDRSPEAGPGPASPAALSPDTASPDTAPPDLAVPAGAVAAIA